MLRKKINSKRDWKADGTAARCNNDIWQPNLYRGGLTLCESYIQRQKCDSNKVQALFPNTLCSISGGQSDKFTKSKVSALVKKLLITDKNSLVNY